MSKTIIVSNRLPVNIQKKGEELIYATSAGGLATGLGSIYKQGDNVWVGWPGLYLTKMSDQKEICDHLKKENMSPVFLTKTDIELFYEGFSNNVLWPLFHYFPKYSVFDESYWKAYKNVNLLFAREVLKHAEENDIFWIHDYQLLLLPGMIREKFPNATIGFFQHIPFPSFEIFRALPWRTEILKGILGADLIGFHTYDDVRHFLSASSRILGIDNKMGEVRIGDRISVVDSFPMGIDFEKFADAAKSPETQKEIETYDQFLGHKKLIISIDRLDYSKGIPERIMAFDKFLDQYPDYKEKVSIIMVVVPSRDKVDLYKKLKVEIDELVGRINGKHGKMGWTPIQYFYRSFPFQSLSAFYKMSDVALVTPLRDGMNLVCKEYIASRTDKTGVLILSEMAGAARELSEAIIINPYDINAIVEGIHTALTMPEEEQIRRNEEMQNVLMTYDIHNWVGMFMKRLGYIKEKQQEMAVRKFNIQIQKQIINDYNEAKHMAIFLDYDGTLSPFRTNPRMAKPDEDLYTLIETLISDPKNKVVLISGRDKDTLDEWFGHLKIDLIAEHGVWTKEGRPYWSLFDYITDEWKEDIRPILELFVSRTPGSFIETKAYSLVWHYRKSDAALGDLRARELMGHLQYLTTNANLKVLEGNKVLEIKSSGINKGRAAQRWLNDAYDFILAAGDDWTDEDTFSVMPDSAYTIKVGFSPSLAKYHIDECSNDACQPMRNLLKSLVFSTREEIKYKQDDPALKTGS